jgi:hypothetical protein
MPPCCSATLVVGQSSGARPSTHSIRPRLLCAGRSPPRLPREVTLRALGDSLDKLSQASPAIKKRLLNAAVLAVAADGTATVAEAELLRAMASALDCPIPPILAGPLATQADASSAP